MMSYYDMTWDDMTWDNMKWDDMTPLEALWVLNDASIFFILILGDLSKLIGNQLPEQ